MKRSYGAKKDANHVEIVTAFRKMGASVIDLSDVGGGVPDLIVCCHGVVDLVDIKNPKTGYGRRGLNKLQRNWAEQWRGSPVYMVYTVGDVMEMVQGDKSKVKSHGRKDRCQTSDCPEASRAKGRTTLSLPAKSGGS